MRSGDGSRRKRLHVMVSNRCNNRCQFCLEDRELRAGSDFSCQAKAMEGYKKRGEILFTCGEPTLSGGLVALVAEAKRLGYRDIELVTNGRRLCYPAYAEELAAAGLTAVTISIHGDTARVHDSLSRSPGSFSQTVSGLANMNTIGRRAGVRRITSSTVVVTRNMKRLKGIAEMVFGSGADRAVFNVVEPSGEALALFDHLVPRMASVAAAVKRIYAPPGREVKVEGIPPCVLGSGVRTGDREEIVIWRDGRFQTLDPCRGQEKGPPCRDCPMEAGCDGVWSEYIKRYGWGEFGWEKSSNK